MLLLDGLIVFALCLNWVKTNQNKLLTAIILPINKEHYWNCIFIKKSGKGAMQPRRIEPLPLFDRDWNEVKLNLMEGFKSNLLFLPERVTWEAAVTYLKLKESWI